VDRPATACELLGAVLFEGRAALDRRSPEAVGQLIGISGRTIRRLEAGLPQANGPRTTTLEALANFFGMRGRFLAELASWGDLGGEQLEARLHQRAREAGVSPPSDIEPGRELVALATALARRETRPLGELGMQDGDAQQRARLLAFLTAPRRDGTQTLERELALDLLAGFARLDRRRQRLLVELARELAASDESSARVS
jgi:hypothetical protein